MIATTITTPTIATTTTTRITATITMATMITTISKMDGRKPSGLMETVDIMDLIPCVGSVHCITQDLALSSVRSVTKLRVEAVLLPNTLNFPARVDNIVLPYGHLSLIYFCHQSDFPVLLSRDADFIGGLAMRRAANAVDLMGLLPQLHDPQSELLLIRSCMGIAKLFFGLRTCQPVHMEEATLFFDKDHILRDSGICGMDDDYVSTLACLRDTIPSFDFSSFTNKDTAPSKAQQTLANVLFSEMVKDMEVYFDMTIRHKAVFECLRAPQAQDFLLAIPIDGLGQHMSPMEYRTILKCRLMIPLFPVDAIYHVCRKACLDSFEEHAVHCKELPGFKY
ncbi:hypothetical protein Tco_0722752 [Tanacetum coccineum]